MNRKLKRKARCEAPGFSGKNIKKCYIAHEPKNVQAMAYKIESKPFFLSLELYKLSLGEGEKALADFKESILGKFDLSPMHVTVLVELIKNMVDHSDKGYLLLRSLDNGDVEFSCKTRCLSISPEERKVRRANHNRSLGMPLMVSTCLDEENAVVRGFVASCPLGKVRKERRHHYSGRFTLH